MPVHLAGLRANAIAGMEPDNLSSLGLEQALALYDMEYLATAM